MTESAGNWRLYEPYSGNDGTLLSKTGRAKEVAGPSGVFHRSGFHKIQRDEVFATMNAPKMKSKKKIVLSKSEL